MKKKKLSLKSSHGQKVGKKNWSYVITSCGSQNGLIVYFIMYRSCTNKLHNLNITVLENRLEHQVLILIIHHLSSTKYIAKNQEFYTQS